MVIKNALPIMSLSVWAELLFLIVKNPMIAKGQKIITT